MMLSVLYKGDDSRISDVYIYRLPSSFFFFFFLLFFLVEIRDGHWFYRSWS